MLKYLAGLFTLPILAGLIFGLAMVPSSILPYVITGIVVVVCCSISVVVTVWLVRPKTTEYHHMPQDGIPRPGQPQQYTHHTPSQSFHQFPPGQDPVDYYYRALTGQGDDY